MSQVNSGNDKNDRMINMFIDELKYLDNNRSTMPGSQIYINIKDYVNKVVDDNIIHYAEDTDENDAEQVVREMSHQFDYDFNSGLPRGHIFLEEQKLDLCSIEWLERAYQYWVWEDGLEADGDTLEIKTDFIMYNIARRRCLNWCEENELPSEEF